METLIVKIDTATNAKLLANFLRTVKPVKSVALAKDASHVNVVSEPSEKYNWTNPSRPATNEEFKQMISEAEAGKSYTTEQIKERFEEWKRKQNL